MDISIIIPAFNEAQALERLLPHIHQNIGHPLRYEIIVSDAGSSDHSAEVAGQHRAMFYTASARGRAVQLNEGAAQATGRVLYFLHADSRLPANFGRILLDHEKTYGAGCFRLAFDHRHWLINFSSWASRFNVKHFQFGDQSLYVRRAVFEAAGGYDAQQVIMEDLEITGRLRQHARFVVMPHTLTTSARKYLQHGVVKTELINLWVYMLFLSGVKPPDILKVYRKLLGPVKKQG